MIPFIRFHQVMKKYPHSDKPAIECLNLEICEGEIITLLGPSGCGKTTTLRMLAGFEPINSGEIYIGNALVNSEKTNVPPEQRGVGMVFQDYGLFPHLTVEKNICFGLHKWNKSERKKRLDEVLDLVNLHEFVNRYPHELSGGQQQRVALARALAPRPKVMLLDEPFSHLDTSLREKVRDELLSILRSCGTTAIIVIHDQEDAFALSDRVVLMNEGIVQQFASPHEMYRFPSNRFVAQFFGKTNFINGYVSADLKHVETDLGKIAIDQSDVNSQQEVTLSIRPESFCITENGKYEAILQSVRFSGDNLFLLAQAHSQTAKNEVPIQLFMQTMINNKFEVGQKISFDIPSDAIVILSK